MQFRSHNDLYNTVVDNLWRIPTDVDLIVGIPRSGLLAANILALQLNLPLADFDGFLRGHVLRSGQTRGQIHSRAVASYRHALIVDDSIYTGATFTDCRARLADAHQPIRVSTYAAYGMPGGALAADIVCEFVQMPRMFEWNYLHHPDLINCCVDIDGVLCLDPTPDENDDGIRYRQFLQDARRRVIPTVRIGHVVTSRLEKYRPETTDWLQRNNIVYDHLHMLDIVDAATRARQDSHAPFKAKVYRATSTLLFIESDHSQAIDIASRSMRPVLSVQGSAIIEPPIALPTITQIGSKLSDTGNGGVSALKRALHLAIGDKLYSSLKTSLGRDNPRG